MRRPEDWALVPPAAMTALYGREHVRWQHDLDWDTTATWLGLERARRNGRVPGFVLRDGDGAVCGWTFYLLHGSELQIGALTAAAPDDTAALLDAVLAAPAALVASRTLFHAYSAAPGLSEALQARGFALDPQRYLTCTLDPTSVGSPDAHARRWQGGDAERAATVLAAAYGGPDPRRTFVPSGALTEWQRYVQELTTGDGCGRFQPALSRVSAEAGGAARGVALVTAVSPGCAHLAQLAVAPGAAGAGLGRRLLAEVMAAAGAAGYRRLSLLVNDDNARARRLYEAAGFTVAGRFAGATKARRRTARAGLPAA